MAFIRGVIPSMSLDCEATQIAVKQQSKVSEILEWIGYLEVCALRPESPDALDSAVEHLLVQLLIQLSLKGSELIPAQERVRSWRRGRAIWRGWGFGELERRV